MPVSPTDNYYVGKGTPRRYLISLHVIQARCMGTFHAMAQYLRLTKRGDHQRTKDALS